MDRATGAIGFVIVIIVKMPATGTHDRCTLTINMIQLPEDTAARRDQVSVIYREGECIRGSALGR
jgi:hypothetical protein